MLTVFKEIFTWWNHQTLGTRINTILFGKLIGEDNFGNKYYENRSGKRWVVYSGEIAATKISNDWYAFTRSGRENSGRKINDWIKQASIYLNRSNCGL